MTNENCQQLPTSGCTSPYQFSVLSPCASHPATWGRHPNRRLVPWCMEAVLEWKAWGFIALTDSEWERMNEAYERRPM